MKTVCIDRDLTATTAALLEKYGHRPPADGAWLVAAGRVRPLPRGMTLLPGWALEASAAPEGAVPLLPWRNERRFIELQRLVAERTVAPLCLCRFSCSTDGQTLDLAAALYRELDLAEWLSGLAIESIMASIGQKQWANVVVRLAGGVLCGIEIGTALPAGSPMLDRHELICGRGVASDRVVDSQLPQHSIYTYTPEGTATYTDTDAELFSFAPDEVLAVRAAYDVLSGRQSAATLAARHTRLAELVGAVFDSERRGQRLDV